MTGYCNSFLKHVCILLALACFGLTTVRSDSTSNELRKYLEQFQMNRHHLNSDGKTHARDFIRETFASFGLQTWVESFVPMPPSTEVATGENVIGMLPGKLARTRDDRLILIGSHYDTMRNTPEGADDNGSGVAALLQVAKLLTSKSDRCTREYSIMFVAFDFEEWEDSSLPGCACAKLGCGSRAFVANFSRHFDLFPNMSVARYGQLQGAIIMDTMMNYNSTPLSQDVPEELEQPFPKQYNAIANNSFRGDFLIAVGRYAYDDQLLNTFSYYYKKDRPKYKLRVFPLPFDGQPANRLDAVLQPFLRSDHVSFWNGTTSGRAIFLSDTADFRSYMKECYHKDCDSMSRVTIDFLLFLSKSCDTIAMTTNDLTKIKCKTSPSHEESSELPVGGSMAIGMLLGSIMSFLGTYCCCIRKKSEDELVANEEQNWSAANPVFEGRQSEETRSTATGNQGARSTATGSAGTGRPSTASGSLETGSRGTGNERVKNEVPKPKDSAEPNIYEAVWPGERCNENEASGRSPGLREPGRSGAYETRGSGTREGGEDVGDMRDSMA